MSLVQIATPGIGSATFATPTQPGNMVLVAVCIDDNTTDISSITDNTSPATRYQDGIPFANGANGQANINYSIPPYQPGGTVTVTSNSPSAKVWAYEISGQLYFLDSWDNNVSDDPSSPLPGSGLYLRTTYNPQPAPDNKSFFCLAICCCQGAGAVVTVDPPWTLDAIQDGDAPAYLYVADASLLAGAEPIVSFNPAAPTPFVIVEAAINQLAEAPPPPTTGNIVVTKATNPLGSPQSFDFTTDYGEPFSLTDGQSNDSGPLAPGTYSVTEIVPDGWTLAVTVGGVTQDPSAIVLEAGQTIRVLFSNTKAFAPPTPDPTHILTMSYFNGWNPPLMMTLSGDWVPNRAARRWNIDPIPTKCMAAVKRKLASPVDQRVNYHQLLIGSYGAASPAMLLFMQPGSYDDRGQGYESRYRIAYVVEKPSQEFPAGGRVMGYRAYTGHALGNGMLLITPYTPDPNYTHLPYQRDLSVGDDNPVQIPGSAPVTHIDGSLMADAEFFTLEFSNGAVAGAWFQLAEITTYGRPKTYTP